MLWKRKNKYKFGTPIVPFKDKIDINNIAKDISLMDIVLEKIVFRSLDARRSGTKRYLGMEGTELIVKEVIEENYIDSVKYYENVKNRTLEILDSIALNEQYREIWYKRYEEWLYESFSDLVR